MVKHARNAGINQDFSRAMNNRNPQVEHLHVNGPWKYKLSELYYEPAVTAAVEQMARAKPLATAV